jgi:hypothetical protein
MLASAERVSKRASLKRALEFSTPEALRKYLKDHPDADKARHKVVKPEARRTKEEPSGKPRQPGKEEAPTKSKPPPIPEEAKKKTKAKPPPIPEEAKKKTKEETKEETRFKEPSADEIARGKSKAKDTTWSKPSLDAEEAEVQRTVKELGVPRDKLLQAAKQGTLQDLDDETWSQLENTDSNDTDTVEKATGKAKEYNRDIARVIRGLGGNLPAPIVLMRKGEPPYLVGGNTRLMAAKAFGVKPKILAVHLDTADAKETAPKETTKEDKAPDKKEGPTKPEAPESGTDSAKPGFTWKGRFKGLSENASKFVSGSAKSFRHFLGDDDFRHEALKEARGALTRAPGKIAASLLETAKHEVKDFKYASSGVKSVLSGGKMTKKQKTAFTEVASHMALAAASASLLASSPLVGAALFAKSLAAHLAAKSVSRSVEKLHILGEVGHVGHGLAHLISHIAAEGKKKQMMEPEEAMVKLVMAAVAKELENLTDKDFAEILEKCGEESEMTKTASRVVTRFLEA